MDFTKLDGFKVFYYLVLLVVFCALMWFLVKSAKDSLKRTGKWISVVDEVIIGLIVLAGFTIIAQLEPSTIINFLVKPLTWGWGLLLKALRFVGIPV